MPTTTIATEWPAKSATATIAPAGTALTATAQPVADPAEITFAALRRYLVTGGTDVIPALSSPIVVADAGPVRDAIAHDSLRVVAETLAATAAAPLRTDPLLLALAMCSATDDDLTRRAALTALPRVARTSEELFLFATFIQGLRGWGRGLRRAVGAWYNDRPLADLVDDILATPGYAGWRHADLLRLGHPKASTAGHDALYRWLVTGSLPVDVISDHDDRQILARLTASTQLQATTDSLTAASLIAEHDLPAAAIPDALRNDPRVWLAVVPRLALTDVVRVIPLLARSGALPGHADLTAMITTRISDDLSEAAPMALVVALRTLPEHESTTDLRATLMAGLVRAARRWARSVGGSLRLAIDPAIIAMPAGADLVRPLDVAASFALAGALAGWPAPVIAGDELVPVVTPVTATLDHVSNAIVESGSTTRPARGGRGAIMALASGPTSTGPGLTVEFASRSPTRASQLADPARVRGRRDRRRGGQCCFPAVRTRSNVGRTVLRSEQDGAGGRPGCLGLPHLHRVARLRPERRFVPRSLARRHIEPGHSLPGQHRTDQGRRPSSYRPGGPREYRGKPDRWRH